MAASTPERTRAVGLYEFGEPAVLRILERSVPALPPGCALVRVHAATVNPTDTLLRRGEQAMRLTDLPPPYTPGMELAGEVVALHPALDMREGAGRIRRGDRVAAIVGPWRAEGGAQQEHVIVDVRSMVTVPDDMSLADAATIPMNGLTALMSINLCGLAPASTLLVTGAAGALGGYVISLARRRGHRVIADAKPEDRDLVAALGADLVVPRGEPFAAAVRDAAPDGVDGVVDGARLGDAVAPLLRDGGTLVRVRPGEPPIDDDRITVAQVSVPDGMHDTAALQNLMDLARVAELPTRIARVLPLGEVAEAHRLIESGGIRGRLVLDLSS